MKKAITILNWVLFLIGIFCTLLFLTAVLYWMMNLAGSADAHGWFLGYVMINLLFAVGGIGWVATYADRKEEK